MPKILVADDNANIQKMVALSFEDRGVEVVSVGNGEAAVRRIPDVNPDLVLADIFMPVRNGYEVCEFVKKDSRFAHVPVILLVGAFDPLDEKEARRVGADGVLKKPFVPPDPLIAMVMSALEKNPKAAAELAKAREPKAPPQEFHTISLPEPATSFRAEPKQVPNFPEPTAEEEASLYGSGTGRRSLEGASPAASSSANAKESQPPIPEFDEAVEEQFDGGATSRDWRRNAMDIEIPAEAANQPAFGDELDAPIFESERDVPPRNVAAPEPVEEVVSAAASPTSAQEESPVMEAPAASVSAAETDFFAPTEEPFELDSAATPSASKSEPAASIEAGPESDAAAPQASHWMDQLAQSSDQPTHDWMSVLSEQAGKDPVAALQEAQHAHDEDRWKAPHSATKESKSEAQFDSERSFSVEPVAPAEQAGESSLANEAAPSAANMNWFSPAQFLVQASREDEAGNSVEHTVIESVPVASKRDESLEVEQEPELPVGLQDANLVQPPRVHVTPEPLLVEDDSAKAGQYGDSQREEIEPMHTFFAPAPAAVEEPAPVEKMSSAIEAAPVLQSEHAEAGVNERIPTGPPANREALSEIPFLTPPPDFFAHPHEQAPAAAADPQTVDAVVQKVLEKLQPQLQDLLSQGVLRPLVENLLQSEVTKKNQ